MQQIHEFPQDVLLVGRIVARSAQTSETSRTTRTTRATWSSWSIRAGESSRFVWAAWLGVVIFITMVMSVCSMGRGIGFTSGIVGFHSS